ncbi:MAG: glycosyltransferase family 9 protein [Candidatus Desantisbacteria bacterium]
MGDMILSLPAISSIKESYPKAHIAILIQEYTRDILWNNPHIDEIIIDHGQNMLELAHQIRDKKFDLAVVLYPSWRNGWLCFFAGIPVRVGTGYKPVGILFNKRAYIHRSKIVCHEIDYCLRLAEKAGARATRRELTLRIKDEDTQYAQSLLKKHGLLGNFPLIGIHPGSGGSALNWSKDNYACLIDGLIKKYDARVVITGSKDEQTMIEQIIAARGGDITHAKPVNLAGQTTVGQLMALFSLYHLFVGPSTGPMHLAAGLGKPVIALFPPLLSQSPAKWGPYGQGHVVLTPEDVQCRLRKCKKGGCRFFNCIDRITAERVLDVAGGIMREDRGHR